MQAYAILLAMFWAAIRRPVAWLSDNKIRYKGFRSWLFLFSRESIRRRYHLLKHQEICPRSWRSSHLAQSSFAQFDVLLAAHQSETWIRMRILSKEYFPQPSSFSSELGHLWYDFWSSLLQKIGSSGVDRPCPESQICQHSLRIGVPR